jgi:multidrug efflux pump subunit AcrA (membrane-fusion protein)
MKDTIFLWSVVGALLTALLGVHIWSTYSAEQEQQRLEDARVATVASLRQILNDVSREVEQLEALLRKVDGAQSTEPAALAATNRAIDMALAERGYNTIDELRARVSLLDAMHMATKEQLLLVLNKNIDCPAK